MLAAVGCEMGGLPSVAAALLAAASPTGAGVIPDVIPTGQAGLSRVSGPFSWSRMATR